MKPRRRNLTKSLEHIFADSTSSLDSLSKSSFLAAEGSMVSLEITSRGFWGGNKPLLEPPGENGGLIGDCWGVRTLELRSRSLEKERDRERTCVVSEEGLRSSKFLSLAMWLMNGLLGGALRGFFRGHLIMVSPYGSCFSAGASDRLCSTSGARVRLSFRCRSATVSEEMTGIVRVPLTCPLLVRISFNLVAFGFCPEPSFGRST